MAHAAIQLHGGVSDIRREQNIHMALTLLVEAPPHLYQIMPHMCNVFLPILESESLGRISTSLLLPPTPRL